MHAKLQHEKLPGLSEAMYYFLTNDTIDITDKTVLKLFTQLDDTDVLVCLKTWQNHPDHILASYAKRLLHRRLMKVKFSNKPFAERRSLKNAKN